MSSSTDNPFDRARDIAADTLERRIKYADKFTGAGGKPFNTRKLGPMEKAAYWRDLPLDRKWEKWNQATPEEQDEIRQLEQQGGAGA